MNEDTRQNSHSETYGRRIWFGFTWLEWLVVTIILLVIVDSLMRGTAAYRLHASCVICRLERTEIKEIDGLTSTTYRENACSKGYASHVESSHEHFWSKEASFAILNHYGQAIGAGDNFDHPGRAIRMLTPEEQIEVYQRFTDPVEAKQLFLSLMDPNVMKFNGNSGDYDITRSLKAWIDSDFVGPWQHPHEPR